MNWELGLGLALVFLLTMVGTFGIILVGTMFVYENPPDSIFKILNTVSMGVAVALTIFVYEREMAPCSAYEVTRTTICKVIPGNAEEVCSEAVVNRRCIERKRQ